MKKKDVDERIKAAQEWAIRSGKNKDDYEKILNLEPKEFNGRFYVAPVSFSKITGVPKRERTDADKKLERQIGVLNERLHEKEFVYSNEMHLTHYDKFIFLILGKEEIQQYRDIRQRINKVNLSFAGHNKYTEPPPTFTFDSDVNLKIKSQEEGWVYLFHIDANGTRSLVYPFEGDVSEIHVSVNTELNLSKEINDKRGKLEALKFRSKPSGPERLVALVLKADIALPVVVSHLLHFIPYDLLFSHEERSKSGIGGGRVNSDNDVTSLSLDQVAIGTLDYFNEGINAPS